MAELDAKFEAAVGVIQGLPKDGSFQPSNEMKLKFYGFYKQAREGPCNGARPSFWDVVARAKYDAWNELGDMSSVAAKEGYIEALKQIIETINLNSDVEKFIEVFGTPPQRGIDLCWKLFSSLVPFSLSLSLYMVVKYVYQPR